MKQTKSHVLTPCYHFASMRQNITSRMQRGDSTDTQMNTDPVRILVLICWVGKNTCNLVRLVNCSIDHVIHTCLFKKINYNKLIIASILPLYQCTNESLKAWFSLKSILHKIFGFVHDSHEARWLRCSSYSETFLTRNFIRLRSNGNQPRSQWVPVSSQCKPVYPLGQLHWYPFLDAADWQEPPCLHGWSWHTGQLETPAVARASSPICVLTPLIISRLMQPETSSEHKTWVHYSASLLFSNN